MIFIASPYGHDDRDVIRKRIAINAKYCGYLLKKGSIPVSPVMFGSKVLEFVNLPSEFTFWDKLSFAYLKTCNELHVLHLDGWLQSRGVKEEIVFAKENNIPIKHIGLIQHTDELIFQLSYEE